MRAFLPVVIAVAALASSAAAQELSPVPVTRPRGDAQAMIAWQNLREPQPSGTLGPQNTWLNAIVHGAVGAGWYWTEHLKTTVDVGGGTSGRQYRYTQTVSPGSTTYSESILRLRETNIDVSQQYQFFHNAWFHPRVGAGLDIAREHRTEQYYPVTIVDNVTHTSRSVGGLRSEFDTRMRVRPFGEIGFKAYMSRRAFFTTDARLRFQPGIDEVRLRFGFGMDF